MEVITKPKRKYTRKVKKEEVKEPLIPDIESLVITTKEPQKVEPQKEQVKVSVKKFYYNPNFFICLKDYRVDTLKYVETFQRLLENKGLMPAVIIKQGNRGVESNKLNSCFVAKDDLSNWSEYFKVGKGIGIYIKERPNISPEELVKFIDNLQTETFNNDFFEIKLINNL